jgi:nucleoside-diphosphate-sugar epimerase
MRLLASSTPEIGSVEYLETLLSEPTPAVVETLRSLPGDLLILGVAGKMGPTLARMARRASDAAGTRRRIIGVARFSTPGVAEALERSGVETIRCDLLDPARLRALPPAPNVIYMTGMKFGSTGNEPLTWAMNAYLPAPVCQQYRESRIVAFSTGNVYGLCPVVRGGSVEGDALAPAGEYAMSCVGRERTFEYFSRAYGIPLALLRLNYACELRYGVLVDLARKVWNEEVINLAMGAFNVIWQADANALALAALAHTTTPPLVLNVAGPETLSVRRVCEQFGHLMNRAARFEGSEAGDAFLSNGQRGHRLFGYPHVGAEQMIGWVADWVRRGGPLLDKPTHFETRDGKF